MLIQQEFIFFTYRFSLVSLKIPFWIAVRSLAIRWGHW